MSMSFTSNIKNEILEHIYKEYILKLIKESSSDKEHLERINLYKEMVYWIQEKLKKQRRKENEENFNDDVDVSIFSFKETRYTFLFCNI